MITGTTASHCVTDWTWNGLHRRSLTQFWFAQPHAPSSLYALHSSSDMFFFLLLPLLPSFISWTHSPLPPTHLLPIFLLLFLPLFLPLYRMGRADPRIQSETLRPLTPLQDYYTIVLQYLLYSLLWKYFNFSRLQVELQRLPKLLHLLQKIQILLLLLLPLSHPEDYNSPSETSLLNQPTNH